MGNWFELGKTEMMVHTKSFEVLTPVLGKDENHVFYEAYPVQNIELSPEEFHIKKGDFMAHIGFDKRHVFSFEKKLINKEYHAVATIIEGADPDTYIQTDFDWGHDGIHHYFRNQKIDCDYATFEIINEYFVRDKNKIFVRPNDVFMPIEGDAESFALLNNSSHGIDKYHVYWLSFFSKENELIRIPHQNPKEVKFMNRYFLRINDSIFYDGKVMPSIDAQSFEIINHSYAKDSETVYYKNQRMPEADAATFVFENGAAHDKNGSYRDGKPVVQKGT